MNPSLPSPFSSTGSSLDTFDHAPMGLPQQLPLLADIFKPQLEIQLPARPCRDKEGVPPLLLRPLESPADQCLADSLALVLGRHPESGESCAKSRVKTRPQLRKKQGGNIRRYSLHICLSPSSPIVSVVMTSDDRINSTSASGSRQLGNPPARSAIACTRSSALLFFVLVSPVLLSTASGISQCELPTRPRVSARCPNCLTRSQQQRRRRESRKNPGSHTTQQSPPHHLPP